jgi:hypothetical protein
MKVLTPIPHNLKRVKRVSLTQKIAEKERKKKQQGEATVTRPEPFFEERREE